MIVCALVLIIAPVIQSSYSGEIGATDWLYRHSVWISRYIQGDFSPIIEYVPLFHWLMLPFVYFDFPVIWLQVVFISLATFGILYFVRKFGNEKMLLYTSFLLAGSIGFVAGASQLMPQSLDYFLFPICLIFYYQNRVKILVPLLIIMFFLHNTGIIFIGILFAHSFLTKRKKMFFPILIMVIVLSPIFWWYQFETRQILTWVWDMEAQLEWESQYLDPLWKFFIYSGFLTWILLPYASYKFCKGKFKFTEMQLLYVIWVVAFLPLPFFNMGWWRMITYQIVPLSLLVASMMSHEIS